MTISFSSDVDFSHYQQDFQKDNRTRILSVLPQDTAISIAAHLNNDVSYINAFTQNGQSMTASNEEIKGWPRQQQQQFVQTLFADASKGVGFYYGRHLVDKNAASDALLHQVFQWLNNEDTLQIVRDLTGAQDIVCASAQATRYVGGNYLTRHNDLHPHEQRRIAYVLNFTEQWHPDWGGNLQFYQNDGTPRDAWTPTFNSMTLFDVNHVHAVTYVAPFALKPRLAITGWFRATPL